MYQKLRGNVAQFVTLFGGAAGQPQYEFFATVDLDNVIEPLNGLVLSLPDAREPIINDIVIQSGGYFTDRRDSEVIVNAAFARKHGIRPGQKIHLLLNNRRQELDVVGTAISSEFVYLVSPGGVLKGCIRVYEDLITNLAFGGADGRTLYITAGKTLYQSHVEIPGQVAFPRWC